MSGPTYRLAIVGDLTALHGIAGRAIAELQKPMFGENCYHCKSR